MNISRRTKVNFLSALSSSFKLLMDIIIDYPLIGQSIELDNLFIFTPLKSGISSAAIILTVRLL